MEHKTLGNSVVTTLDPNHMAFLIVKLSVLVFAK